MFEALPADAESLSIHSAGVALVVGDRVQSLTQRSLISCLTARVLLPSGAVFHALQSVICCRAAADVERLRR